MSYTVEPLNSGQFGDECFIHCSEVGLSLEVEMYGRQEANSVSIVGRFSTLWSVHSWRFNLILASRGASLYSIVCELLC